MINLESTVSTQVVLFFNATPSTTPSVSVFKDGSASSLSLTITETASGSGVYKIVSTPSSTGQYYFVTSTQIIACVNVVTKTVATYLKNLEDEALGSWSWNKTSGVLTMYRQTGEVLATFDVAQSLTEATRERA